MIGFKQGVDISIDVTREGLDFTGYTIWSNISLKGHVVSLEVIRLNDAEGKFGLRLGREETRRLKPGICSWDVFFQDPTGYVSSWPNRSNLLIEILESPSNAG